MRVFLNGEFLPKKDARISVLDRGFLFGDGIYEVIPVYGNRLFRFDEHMQRLENSLSAIAITSPYTAAAWTDICERLVNECPGEGDKAIYIQVTRGVGEREHLYREGMIPTVFVMCNPAPAHGKEDGVSAITHQDIRWLRCYIKAITLLPNILMRQLARETDGSYEAILIRDGAVSEGAASNVFVVKDGRVITPPKDGTILPGITRDLIVELLQSADIPCAETVVTEEDLLIADEIWLTGSMTGIAPVVTLNGISVGKGVPGILWQRVHGLFLDYIEHYKHAGSSA